MEMQVNLDELRKKSLYIATPCYGGLVSSLYHMSVINLTNRFNELGVRVKHACIENESLVTRARNNMVTMFLSDKEHFTHFMFIDADIQFNPDDILTMLATDMDVLAGTYPKKCIQWNQVQEAVYQGIPPHHLAEFGGDHVINFVPQEGGMLRVDLTKPVEVMDAGTGFMMIRRDVFEKMNAEYPQYKYTPDYTLGIPDFDSWAKENGVIALFDTLIVPSPHVEGAQRYLSEDYAFCWLWRKMGGKIFVAPWINLVHHGSYHYRGNIKAVLQMKNEAPKVETQ